MKLYGKAVRSVTAGGRSFVPVDGVFDVPPELVEQLLPHGLSSEPPAEETAAAPEPPLLGGHGAQGEPATGPRAPHETAAEETIEPAPVATRPRKGRR